MATARPGLSGYTQIALGWTGGHSTVTSFGRNTDVDAATTPEDIWAGGGLYTGFPSGALSTAEPLSIVSSSAADAAAGTGMRTLYIEGLDATGRVQIEVVTLNGVTPVVTTTTWYRAFRASGISGGSGQTNAGTVTIKHATTTANVFVVITPGTAQSHSAVYTVPFGQKGLVTSTLYACSNAATSAQEATVALAMRTYQSSIWLLLNDQIVTTSNPLHIDYPGGPPLPALTDLSVRAVAATADNLSMTALIEMLLLPC